MAHCGLMTTHHISRRLGSCFVLLTLAGAACGDDDAAPSKADFQKSANAICATAEEHLGPIFEEIFPKLETATEEERQAATDGLLAVLTKEIDDLDALEAPDSITDDVDAMIAAVRAAEDAVREQGAGFWLDQSDPFAEADQRAADLGLDACAGDSAG